MLSKSAARAFFLLGTIGFSAVFLLLTIDTIQRVPAQTKQQNLTEQVVHGKHLWEQNNCMGCHTLLGEGAYYAPELTKVYERRGPEFIKAMLRDPQAMYPGQRRMVKYHFTDTEIAALVAFLQWIGDMDLNGFPPKPTLLPVAVPAPATGEVVASAERPKIFNQMCLACHSLEGQGGVVGPALDGVGNRRSYDNLVAWITDPPQQKPGTLMPQLPLTQADIVELASFLSKMKQR
jgi:nitric oxide reductase subunit C